MKRGVHKTDQAACYDERGSVVPCEDTGQDGRIRAGIGWPEPRFVHNDHSVIDRLTGLMWTRDVSMAEFPLMWEEGLEYVTKMNQRGTFGNANWRLPNRKELFSLVSHANINPSLPADHPFINVFTGYYWTSTTCVRLPRQAWYVHFGGGRMFKGMKYGSYMVWPVRSDSRGLLQLPRSGQSTCFNEFGNVVPCSSSGQDGALQTGSVWPEPRFVETDQTVLDRVTGLVWTKDANCGCMATDWKSALDAIKAMNDEKVYCHGDWRLPNIRELESLTDMGAHSPALSPGHPFKRVQEFYWSSTTSTYDPRYAWVLYSQDGAVGVGFKLTSDCFTWAVRGGQFDTS